MKLKTLLEDKFWIVEDQGENIGTLAFDEEKFVFSGKKGTQFFTNKKQIKTDLGIDLRNSITVSDGAEEVLEVHGYPCSVRPYNTMFNVKQSLPLFTKSDKSKSLYCAGYYVIKFEKGWVKSFCPKLVTIERYESKGPFKTESQMKEALWNAK